MYIWVQETCREFFRMNVCLFMSYLFLMGNEIISFRMITSSPKYILYVGTRWKFEDPDVLIILVSFGPIMLPGSATKSTWFFWSGAIIAAWNIWSRYVLVVNIQIHFRNLPIFLCMLSECCFCWQLWKLPFILIDLRLFFLFIYTINFNFRRRNYCDLKFMISGAFNQNCSSRNFWICQKQDLI